MLTNAVVSDSSSIPLHLLIDSQITSTASCVSNRCHGIVGVTC